MIDSLPGCGAAVADEGACAAAWRAEDDRGVAQVDALCTTGGGLRNPSAMDIDCASGVDDSTHVIGPVVFILHFSVYQIANLRNQACKRKQAFSWLPEASNLPV